MYIDTDRIDDIIKLNLLDIPEELKSEIENNISKGYLTTKKTIEDYFEYPLSTLFLINDYKNMEDSLKKVEEQQGTGNIVTTPIGATLLIDTAWKSQKQIKDIDSKINLSQLSQTYVDYHYKDVSPFALSVLIKIFLNKNNELLNNHEMEKINLFLENLRTLEESNLENTEKIFNEIFNTKEIIVFLNTIISSVHNEVASNYEETTQKKFPTANIYFKILEMLRIFSKLINMKNQYFKVDNYLSITPAEIKENEVKRFEGAIKSAVQSYKNSITSKEEYNKPLVETFKAPLSTETIAPEKFALNQDKLQIALLIDCDNAPARAVEGVINELSKYGIVNVRKAYGDWKSPLLKSWEAKLHQHVIMPVQQFAYTKGKNATDIAMAIDTMEILYTKDVKAFALMTSDSDFTPLIMKLLSNGMTVFGFGEQKTPSPFVHACSRFIYTENLMEESGTKQKTDGNTNLNENIELIKLLNTAIEQTSNDTGWSHIAQLGIYLNNNSSFSPINYGYQKLGQILREINLFEIQMDGLTMYVRKIDNRESF